MINIHDIVQNYPLFLVKTQQEDKCTEYTLFGFGDSVGDLTSEYDVYEIPDIINCIKTRAEVKEIINACTEKSYENKWVVSLGDEDEPDTKKSVIPELVEKGIVTMEEGEFIHDHMKSQNRTEYTFERDKYTITIKIHKEENK